MKKIIFIFLFIYGSLWNHGMATQYTRLSNIRISLLTVDPGNKFHSVFGHSAIRIKIDSSSYDVVYNYGMFSLKKPDFYYNLVNGKMRFHLSKDSYETFISEYEHDQRSVHEQVFDMDSTQAMFAMHCLENDHKYENRYYRYLFFHDNCATRIRDLILQTFNGMTLPESQKMPTYRNLIHRYLQKYPWARFVIDIVSGLSLDQKIGVYEQMFLPDCLSDAFERALFHGPIVKETNNLFVSEQPDIQPSCPTTPTVACCFILALAFFFSYVSKGSKIFDFVLFFSAGIVGLLVLFLWFFTDHNDTVNNLNIIWALPTHTVMAFILLSKRHSDFTRKYFLAIAIIGSMLIVSWIFLPQRLNPALISIVLAIVLRGAWIYTKSTKSGV